MRRWRKGSGGSQWRESRRGQAQRAFAYVLIINTSQQMREGRRGLSRPSSLRCAGCEGGTEELPGYLWNSAAKVRRSRPVSISSQELRRAAATGRSRAAGSLTITMENPSTDMINGSAADSCNVLGQGNGPMMAVRTQKQLGFSDISESTGQGRRQKRRIRVNSHVTTRLQVLRRYCISTANDPARGK